MYEDPSWYSKFSEDHQKEAKWALGQFWDKLQWSTDEKVLDIGCGSGDATCNILLPAVEASCSQLIGVDMSPQMVSYSQSKWSHSKLSFRLLDISTKEDPLDAFDKGIKHSGGFDKIFSFFCLQWVKDKKRAAENICRLLKPGGQAHILLVVRSGVYNVWDKLATSEKWRPYLPDVNRPLNDYIYMDDYGEVLFKFLTDAGLVVDEWKSIERKNAFVTKTDTDEEKTMRLRSVDPFVRLLPEEKKNEYLKDLLETVKAEVSHRGATDYTGLHVLFRKN
ncbi:juvenile hormone acid O-methyltransferase [Halyomorpha halys]|uniref:juvenile hormone acid O-methyltransferase n=1 Tax=Halyomorpha halys TaxID=286706 RepID=UPI0006D5043D|nr:juvenile hormone acid O-methyltransferase-like [Halyomorpha halys]XP_014279175.1 juvenile hormone acid O-methyltransferase-like [Halyomorpha halys]XP_014279176.1 juvenile hormone acid O-methyltransferase-like [Halyomorpha halys]